MERSDNISELKDSTVEQSWYAIRTFNCQEQKVGRFLTERGLVHFIPMAIRTETTENENTFKRILVPAIHNLLFVQRRGTNQQMLQILKECSVPISLFRYPGTKQACEITSREMTELRMLCDPQFNTSLFFTQNDAEAIVGKNVRVIQGPFKGSVGRLVRKKKQYYFLKIVIGMGVMARISRWYCEPI